MGSLNELILLHGIGFIVALVMNLLVLGMVVTAKSPSKALQDQKWRVHVSLYCLGQSFSMLILLIIYSQSG